MFGTGGRTHTQVGGFATEMSPDLQRHVRGLPHTAALLERLTAVRGRAPAELVG